MPRRRRRRERLDPDERDWLRRANIATRALFEMAEVREAIACHVCGRTREQTKLWFFMTTGEDDDISQGEPTVVVACDEHDPNQS